MQSPIILILSDSDESFTIAEKRIDEKGLNKRKKRPEIGEFSCDLLRNKNQSCGELSNTTIVRLLQEC
ncbi:unnamed protein product [Caenorhabditis nigoni]